MEVSIELQRRIKAAVLVFVDVYLPYEQSDVMNNKVIDKLR